MFHLILGMVIAWNASPISSANALQIKDKNELDRWAVQKQNELFRDCSKLVRDEWLKRYERIGIDFVMKVEEIGPAAVKDRQKSPLFWEWGEVVYPRHLPRGYPMKGAFGICFEHFDEVGEFEECQKGAYRKNPPAVLKKFISCLKRTRG